MPLTGVRMDIPRLDPTKLSHVDTANTTAARPTTASTPSATQQAQWEQALNSQRLQNSVPARLNLSEVVIQRERQSAILEQPLAYSYSARLNVPEVATPPPAPAPVAAPATVATTAAAATTPVATASTVTATESSAGAEGTLPLNQITQQQGLLRSADVHVDPTSNRWSAEWPSPKPFHYGMVLKPALAQFIKEGQAFSFQTGADQTQTIANRGGEIVVSNNTGKETVLDSQGLRHLLMDKIKSNGFELYLTQTGSLVLATTGNLARSMALAR